MRWLVILGTIVVLFLGSCSSPSSESDSPLSIDSPSQSNGNQSVKAQSLVVRLCPGVSERDAGIVAARHGLSVLKKASPTILELGWSDQRTIDTVIKELGTQKSVFCHVQPNYQYRPF